MGRNRSNATAPAVKGNLVAGTGTDTSGLLTVGANDTVLMADSSTATGLKWATPAAGGGMTLISTTTLSGSSTTIASIPSTYKDLKVVIFNAICSSAADPSFRLNGGSTQYSTMITGGGGPTANTTGIFVPGGTTSYPIAQFDVFNYASATANKTVRFSGSQGTASSVGSIWYPSNSAVTSFDVRLNTGSWSSGTVLLYGVN